MNPTVLFSKGHSPRLYNPRIFSNKLSWNLPSRHQHCHLSPVKYCLKIQYFRTDIYLGKNFQGILFQLLRFWWIEFKNTEQQRLRAWWIAWSSLPCNLTQLNLVCGDSAQIVMAQIIENLLWLRELLCKWDHNLLFFLLVTLRFILCLDYDSLPFFFFFSFCLRATCENIIKPGIKAAVWQDTPHLERERGRDWFPLTQRKYFLLSTFSTLPPLLLTQPCTVTKEKNQINLLWTRGAAERPATLCTWNYPAFLKLGDVNISLLFQSVCFEPKTQNESL